MKKVLFLLFIFIVLFISCKKTEKKINNVDIEKKYLQQSVNSNLQHVIESLRDSIPDIFDKENIFYSIFSLQKNDSSFLSIAIDIRPPYLLENHDGLGYIKIENNYLCFFGDISDKDLFTFVDSSMLESKLSDLSLLYNENSPIYDGYKYIYYIDKLNNLIYIRKEYF